MTEFPAVDYTQYQSWPRVIADNGATYYRVPGTGWLLDPFLSSVKGRPMLFVDPTPQVKERQEEKDAIKRQQKMAERAAGPWGQLPQIAGGVAGTVGGAYLTEKLLGADPVKTAVVDLLKAKATEQGAAAVGNAITTQAAQQGAAALAAPNVVSAARGGAVAAQGLKAPEVISAARGGAPAAAESGLGGTLGTIGGVAGTALGAYQAIQGIKNHDPLSAGMGGAGIGFGLNALGIGLGPIGWGLALAGPALTAFLAGMGDKDRWKEEQDRIKKLRESGIQWFDTPDLNLKGGRTVDQLVAIEQAKKQAGQYSNEEFAKTRDESKLQAEDIWGYSTFGETFGNDWAGASAGEAGRRAVAQDLLAKGKVREAKGQISFEITPEEKEQYLAILRGQKPPVIQPPPAALTTEQPEVVNAPTQSTEPTQSTQPTVEKAMATRKPADVFLQSVIPQPGDTTILAPDGINRINPRTGAQTTIGVVPPGQGLGIGSLFPNMNLLAPVPIQSGPMPPVNLDHPGSKYPMQQNATATPVAPGAPQQPATPVVEQQQQQVAEGVKNVEADVNNAPVLNEFQQKLLELRRRMKGPNATIKTEKDKEYDRLGKLLGKRMGGD